MRFPNAEIHLHLWFRGGPVDGWNGDEEIGDWHEWEVVRDRVPPKPPPEPVPPKPTPVATKPRTLDGPASGKQASFVYAGGMAYTAFEYAIGF